MMRRGVEMGVEAGRAMSMSMPWCETWVSVVMGCGCGCGELLLYECMYLMYGGWVGRVQGALARGLAGGVKKEGHIVLSMYIEYPVQSSRWIIRRPRRSSAGNMGIVQGASSLHFLREADTASHAACRRPWEFLLRYGQCIFYPL